MTTAQSKLNQIVAQVIDNIESNNTGLWGKPWTTGLPANFASKTVYGGLNILTLLTIQTENNYSSNYWLTFNQIKKLGGKLKKGEQASPVFFFKIIEKEEKKEEETATKNIPILKYYNVFNLDQVANINIKKKEELKENQNLNDFVANTGVKVKNDIEAFYNPKKDFIGMPNLKLFKSETAYASTLLHEIAHSTGHKNRLDRDLTGKFGSEKYAKEECIAELTSMFLCAHLNIKNEAKNSEAYIKSWLINGLKANPKMLWQLSKQAQKAFDYLIASQKKEEIAA